MDSEKYIEACRESDNEKFKHPARLDAEDAYRRGVEDMRALELLRIAHDEMQKACFEVLLSKFPKSKQFVKERRKRNALRHTEAAIVVMDKAFHGARGIARVEIRQRLEKLKEGNGNV